MFSQWQASGIRRIKQTWSRLKDSSLARNPLVSLAWRVFKEMGDDDATHLAAGVAYYAIFSLFPLLLGLLAIAGQVLSSETLARSFLSYVTGYLPGSEDLVAQNVSGIVQFRGVLGLGAVVGLLWSASAVFGAISRSVNRAWDVPNDRPFYIAKPLQIGMAFVVGIIFLISTSATSVIEVLSDPSRDLGIPGQDFLPELGLALGLANVALRALPWGLDLILFLLIYRYVPNCKTYWRYIWPGALVAAVLFEVAKGLFIWYLDNLASYRQVYGPLTSVMILLLWTYLSSLILILGAEISSEYGRMRRGLERGTLIN